MICNFKRWETMVIEKPKPNVTLLMDILKGQASSNRVFPMELIIDDEILKQYCEQYLKRPWVDYNRADLNKRAQYWDNIILCYYHLGYSGLRVSNGLTFAIEMLDAMDTADLSKGTRKWANHSGKIKNQHDFDTYPWPSIADLDLWDYDYVAQHLPEGMGIYACVYGGIFEMLCEYLVGFEEMSYMLFDQEALLNNIFTRVGDLLYQAYEKIIQINRIVCIFQGDDLGYTQGLLFSPDFYKKYVYPWHKRCVDLAHQHHKLYILHSCGNLRTIKNDLIALGIDAKHSFEDKGWDVIDFYNKMHPYMGVIGGVDMDKLCRMPQKEFIAYCHHILDHCTKHQRYAFGSGNSISNYVPLEKLLLMLKIGHEYVIGGNKHESK